MSQHKITRIYRVDVINLKFTVMTIELTPKP